MFNWQRALGNACLAAVQAYDAATESEDRQFGRKKKLDSTLVLMITKAWSAAKELNMMKDEVKDILYHLYKTAVGNLQRLVPKEIRIVKYRIRIEDPEEQLSALKDAFTPGEEVEGTMWITCTRTTPEKLHTWIKSVLDAYHLSGEGTLIREARDLLNPEVIQKLEVLKKVVEKNFM
ncbi:Uncharacterized protein HKD37_15G042480 [Glycine soja]